MKRTNSKFRFKSNQSGFDLMFDDNYFLPVHNVCFMDEKCPAVCWKVPLLSSLSLETKLVSHLHFMFNLFVCAFDTRVSFAA